MGNQPKIKYFNFHFLLIYIIILFHNSVSKNIKRSLIKNASEIKIKFESIGMNKYLSDDYSKNKIKSVSISHEKETIYFENKLTCDINDDGKTIILIFDESINTCENMFKGLNNIIEVDLSHFDSPKVQSMAHMFNGCNKLAKITFGKMDTSKIEKIEYFLWMFKIKITCSI